MSVKGEKRVRTNEIGAGKAYGEKDWKKEKKGGRGKRREEGVKREWGGKGLGEGREEREMEKGAGN